jgi:transposase
MAKRKFVLSPTELSEIRAEYHQSQDDVLNKKLLAVQLYGIGRKVKEILDLTQCSRSRLMAWCKQYRTKGIEGIRDQRRGGNHYQLTAEQKSTLEDLVKRYTPHQLFGDKCATQAGAHWTSGDLKQLVYQKFEVIYKSHSSYWMMLTDFGLSYQRTETIYKSRSQSKVAEFEEELEKN